ncbi:hypothetical protein BDEG_24751 [Batrachochytrium dendrobatidis JEL423]|uniref:40S ribosomal protein S15 n=1 Tax=Batrachochytrium dendrobatidis (strain JEL423) TaxID=403673 RepID=A0A177WN41_BATDL|nr:hypothetical protein BDEG_24751 [Batrachochytrium dendrobatidis JEL423]
MVMLNHRFTVHPIISADTFDTQAAEDRKKRSFRKFSYRGVDLEQLLDLSSEQPLSVLE